MPPCEILVSQPAAEPVPLVVKAGRPNHWTIREYPEIHPFVI